MLTFIHFSFQKYSYNVFNICRYLGGETVAALSISFLIGKTTVRRYVNEVSKAVIHHLASEFMPMPKTTEEWLFISEEFEKKRNFPHVLGAIDGKHCKVIKPDNSGSQFYNYKNFFSIVLLAICDADYKFIYCQCGSYGSESDGGVFKDSMLSKWLEEDLLNIPKPKDILGFGKIPYFFIGDAAFAQSSFILKPYSGVFLSADKEHFNKRLSSARMTIEQTFGIASSTFRFLLNGIYADPAQAEDQILSACVIHNILRYFNAPQENPPYGATFEEMNPDGDGVDNYRDVLKDILFF